MRHYSSVASEKELSGQIDNSTTSMTVNNTTGLPASTPFSLIVDPDTPSEEIVEVTAVNGNVLTITRGVDGTVALSHEQGAVVIHGITARDLQESRDHENATSDVHGVDAGSDVVGTNTVQTLEGKTIDGGDNTLQNVPQSAITALVSDQATQNDRLTAAEASILDHAPRILAAENDIDALDAEKIDIASLGSNWLTALTAALGSGWTADFARDTSTMQATWDEEVGAHSVSSTTSTFGSPSCGAVFTAPPSGVVVVIYSAQWEPNTSNTMHTEIEVRAGTSGGGALHVTTGETRFRLPQNTDSGVGTVSNIGLITGLTPGNTYTAWLKHLVGGGTGHLISERRIVAIPIL